MDCPKCRAPGMCVCEPNPMTRTTTETMLLAAMKRCAKAHEEMQRTFEAYLAGYVLSTDEGADYNPSEFERLLIEDAAQGLLADESFLSATEAWLIARRAIATAKGEDRT